jgi:hypothetical protein
VKLSVEKKATQMSWLKLISGNEEYLTECFLSFYGFGWAITLHSLPGWILPPHKERPLGKNYTDIIERVYGLSYLEGHLSFYFGKQFFSQSGSRRIGFFLPWIDTRYIRHSLLTTKGEISYPNIKEMDSEERERIILASPELSQSFDFLDFDGTKVTARVNIEEREWHRGTGLFKWVRFVSKPIIQRHLELCFSEEVGRGKKSWKGGTLQMSVAIAPGESPEECFKRYCSENGKEFLGSTVK